MSADSGWGLGPDLGPAAGQPGPGGRTNYTKLCVVISLVLGIVAVFAGFLGFVVVVLFGIVGWVVGRVLDGKLDLAALLGRFSSK